MVSGPSSRRIGVTGLRRLCCKTPDLLCYAHCVPVNPDQQAYNFNSLTIEALPEIRLLAVESGGNGLFQQYPPKADISAKLTR